MSKENREPMHQTVGWAVEQLKQYPENAQLRFATAPGSSLAWASDYVIEKGTQKGYVYIDIEQI